MRRRSQAAASTAAAGTAAAAAASQLPPPRVAPQQPWRKVLWARQEGYDDYHTGESFLEDLVVNATVPHRDYRTVVWSALVVDQQLATVAAVGSASHHLYKGTITSRQVLLADALLMLLGALLYVGSAAWGAASARAGSSCRQNAQGHSPPASPAKTSDPVRGSRSGPAAAAEAAAASSPPSLQQLQAHPAGDSWRTRIADGLDLADGLSSMAALAAATALLSPLLGTLTETVSSDSIIACACLLLLAHLYLHDYHFSANLTAQLSGSLALGCAVCGSVLIASRLGSPEAVHAQLLLSLELYMLGPYCRRQVAAASCAAHLALTCAMVAAAAALLAPQSVLITSSFCCAVLFVTFLCPMWLVRIHKFKAAINGPWDEAVPRLSAAVTRHLSRQ